MGRRLEHAEPIVGAHALWNDPVIRFLLTILLAVAAAWPVHAAVAGASITAEQALRDLRILKRGLTELHPGAYRYITPAQLDAEFERANALVANGSDRVTMFLLASRIAAAVRCGHTWTNPLNQSEALQNDLFARADKLPLTLRLVSDRFLVTGSAAAGIKPGDELVAIDGRTAPDIVDGLMPYLRADGSSDGKRRAQIDSGRSGGAMDRLFPLLHPPVDGRYRLQIRRQGRLYDFAVAATATASRSQQLTSMDLAEPNEDWSFNIVGDVATLTLPTFSFWREEFAWQAFLTASFDRMADVQVPYLVIDLRRNEGGDGAIGQRVLAHLLHTSYRQPESRTESAYERVPYALARHLDTWNFDFFDRTGQVRKGPGRNWVLIEQPVPVTIAPVAKPYGGTTILLVGPVNSSAGYLLARDLQASKAALLIGRGTGGNRRGLNGGELAWLTLPASGVAVDIPLLASIFDGQADSGVTPDQLVVPDFRMEATGRDPTLSTAYQQIAQWRRQATR